MLEQFAGIFLTGLVIKLMDDWLDRERDRLTDRWNSAFLLGDASLPYVLVVFIPALYLNFKDSVSLFSASYLIGMAYDGRDRLPSGLKGWQEGVIVFCIGLCLTSFENAIQGLILILLLQLADDFIDFKEDRPTSRTNLIKNLGLINSLLTTVLLLMLAVIFLPVKLLYFLAAAGSLYLLFYLWSKQSRQHSPLGG